MGIWDRVKKRFGGGEQVVLPVSTYILKKKKGKGSGLAKVFEMSEPADMETLYPSLEPGFYHLHKYTKGKSGFDVVWGPIEVLGDGSESEPIDGGAKQPSGVSRITGLIKELSSIKDEAQEEYKILSILFGNPQSNSGDILDQIVAAKEKFTTLQGIFGTPTTSGTQPPKYEGSLPMWAHPDVIPRMVDQSLNNIEKRLKNMGLIEKGSAVPDKELITLPEKPKKKVISEETSVIDKPTEENPDESKTESE